MWDQYRAQYLKTAWPVQGFILTSSGVFLYASHAPGAVLHYFVTMQMVAAAGAVWAVRLRNKIARAAGAPLP